MAFETLECAAAKEAIEVAEPLVAEFLANTGKSLSSGAQATAAAETGTVPGFISQAEDRLSTIFHGIGSRMGLRTIPDGLSQMQNAGFEHSITRHELSPRELFQSSLASPFKHEATAVPTYESLMRPRSGGLPVPYKVLTSDGLSPAAHSVSWPLPELQTSGEWKPGAWLNLDQTPKDAYSVGSIRMQTRPALHVSNVPGQWTLGQRDLRVFEAELSPPDQALWEKVARQGTQFDPHNPIPITLRDFPAQRVRLTRELFGEELRNITAK